MQELSQGSDDQVARLAERMTLRMVKIAEDTIRSMRAQGLCTASDLAQELWLVILRRRDTFMKEGTSWTRSFTGWARGIATMHLKGLKKKAAVRSPHDRSFVEMVKTLPPKCIGVIGRAIKSEEEEQIRKCLDQLSPADREIVDLKAYKGLSHAEIADELDAGIGACRARYSRATRRLEEIACRDFPGLREMAFD